MDVADTAKGPVDGSWFKDPATKLRRINISAYPFKVNRDIVNLAGEILHHEGDFVEHISLFQGMTKDRK